MKAKPLVRQVDGLLECYACNRFCKIPEGQTGYCGVRANDNGKLNLIVYGRPCAISVDPIEKKPLFHFLPGSDSYSLGTFGCNFSCDFCQNWDISQAPHASRKKDPKQWRNYFERLVQRCRNLPPELAVKEAVGSGCKTISFTYNEPVIFTEYALDIMDASSGSDLRFVYVTNGYGSAECRKILKGRLHAANIDLKSFNDNFYRELCKSSLEPVLESIKTAKKYKIHTEVTTLIIPGKNDDPDELSELAGFLASVDKEMPWHVTAFHPSYKMLSTPSTTPEILLKAKEIGKDAGIKHIYLGNVPHSYSAHESTYCPKCNKLVIERVAFNTVNNNIINGKCRFCKQKIKGVWK